MTTNHTPGPLFVQKIVAERDDFMRFDDGDIPLADYCARALHRSKP